MTAPQLTAPCLHPPGVALARALVALVKTMLEIIARCQEAVLQDDRETLAVIRNGVIQVVGADSTLVNAASEQNLKIVLTYAVRTHELPFVQRSLVAHLATRMRSAALTDVDPAQRREETIADWFSVLSQVLNAAHPQAAHMLRLRLLGLDSRQIAERLQLPPRLVQKVFHTMGSDGVLTQSDAGAAS